MSSTIGLIGPIYLIWVRLVWSKHYSGNCLPTLHGHQHGSFWWRDVLKLQQQFKGTSSITLANGATCFLWLDLWNETYPELFSFCKNTTITIQSAAHAPQFHDFVSPSPVTKSFCSIPAVFFGHSKPSVTAHQ